MKEIKNVKNVRLLTMDEYYHCSAKCLMDVVGYVNCWTSTPNPSFEKEICVIRRESGCIKKCLTVTAQRPYEKGDVLPVIEMEEEEPVGSLVSYLGHEWRVVMPSLAVCVREIMYIEFRADKNAEDAASYESSDVRAMVDAWRERADFLGEQDATVFKRFKDSSIYRHIKDVTLLSVEQFRDFIDKGTEISPVHPSDYDEVWWLADDGAPYSRIDAYAANSFGECEEDDVYSTPVRDELGVRPILVLDSANGMKAGDAFDAGSYTWTYLGDSFGEHIALCDDFVFESPYYVERETDVNARRYYVSSYTFSDVKWRLNEWAGKGDRDDTTKVYRWMSPVELRKYLKGETITPLTNYARIAHTTGSGVFFFPRDFFRNACRKDNYYKCLDNVYATDRFANGVVSSNAVLVEFEVLDSSGMTEEIGMYADPKTFSAPENSAAYHRLVDVNEVCFPSYSQKTLKAKRVYVNDGMWEYKWYKPELFLPELRR